MNRDDEEEDYMCNLFEYYCSQNTSLWINFEQLQFNSKQVYISEKLRVLALKDKSIFDVYTKNQHQ